MPAFLTVVLRKCTAVPFRLRWLWLLALFAAPLLVVSLSQDIGATAHDAAAEHILRAVAFSAVIDDGVLYPRWTQALHWGLGSPLFTFQPPLPYYALDLLYRLGLPHDLGWRWLVAGGFGLAFLGTYLLVREITGRRWPALAAAAAYIYAPYVLRNALERGSNEAYSVFLYPLVLWSLLRLARPDSHAAADGTLHEKSLARHRGFSQSDARCEKPAEASSPDENGTRTSADKRGFSGISAFIRSRPCPIFGLVLHVAGGATANENVRRTRTCAQPPFRVRRFAPLRAQPAKASSPGRRAAIFGLGTGRFLFATLAWAACIGSHVLGPLILAPFAGLLALYLGWRRRTLAPLLALLAGGLLTAAVWMPMIPEQAWVHVERDFSQPEAIPAANPIALSDLLAPPAVYDVNRGNNNMGDRVGLAHTLLLLAAAPAALLAWRRERKSAAALLAAVVAGLFLFWLLTAWSDWIWRLGGEVTARLLYRTRLMGAQALAAAIAIGLLAALAPARWQRWAALVAGGGLLLAALPSLYPQYQHNYALSAPPYDLADVRAMEIRHHGTALTAFGEFTPLARTAAFDEALLNKLGADFDAQARPLAGSEAGLMVRSAQVRNQAWDLELSAAQPVTATLHLLYYPRWQAQLDGQPVPLAAQAETGYVQAAVPAGEHHLTLRYGATPFESAGLALSGLTALALLGVMLISPCRVRYSPRKNMTKGWNRGFSRSLSLNAKPPEGSIPIPERREPAPASWLLTGLTALLILKVAVVDPHTTLLRSASTCAAIRDAGAQVDVTFGEHIRLCGYSLPRSTFRAGEWLTVTLYWQIDAAFTQPAYSFVHLLGPFNPATGNPLWGQHDKTVPAGFILPEWQPGKLYWDRYRFQVDPAAQPGGYQLEVGWWQTGIEARLKPVITAGTGRESVFEYDSLLIGGIVIR